MSKQELTDLINLVYDAVDSSKVGPIVIGKDASGSSICGRLAMEVMEIILGQIIPKPMTGNVTMSEPKEPWQE